MQKKKVYLFTPDRADGDKSMKHLLGGKGANLAEMTRLGIPVPPGFTVTTDVCREYLENDGRLSPGLYEEVDEAIAEIEKTVGRKFGDKKDPLLVSVRSGAMISMPGMMDTVLNLGLTRDSVAGVIEASKNEQFAWDIYRRLVQMYGDVVLGIDDQLFEEAIENRVEEKKLSGRHELGAEDFKFLSKAFEDTIEKETGKPFPQDPKEQLHGAIEAVFRSWKNPRAYKYREINNIPDDMGTAVTAQTMVFGNRGETSATGVAFTRDPSTGVPGIYGEYLVNAQGEDVVAGLRTPGPLKKRPGQETQGLKPMEEVMPEQYKQFIETAENLEKHYKDMQDIEFTVEDGKLWILQTRNGKRTAQAAIRVAVDMVNEGLIGRREAILRLNPEDLNMLLHPTFDPKAERNVMAMGLPASPGAVSGKVVFSADVAEEFVNKGEKVILVRRETSPEDIHGMQVAEGILTARGGMTSHAAVVGRGMGKCCVVGCGDIGVHESEGYFETKKGVVVKEGDTISLDGSAGEVIEGSVATRQADLDEYLTGYLTWADSFRSLKVRANADTPKDCSKARELGAQGVGLCRTEHMFFDKERIDVVRQMILSKNREDRMPYIEELLAMQTSDFEEIFKVMEGLPVTIRLLDPPLHEFLPPTPKEILEFAKRIDDKPSEIAKRIDALRETNPMLGHRGCRLGITYPEIYEMQVRAILTAAAMVSKESPNTVFPEIMVPLVSDVEELRIIRRMIERVAKETLDSLSAKVEYSIGTMIEIPRAALTADEVAKEADFFSFGTNDLTQMTFGLSRDDAGKFLPEYKAAKIFERDPFASIDQKGVRQLVEIGTERGRKTKNGLKVGVCGEHGGDPSSIQAFHETGLDYVSCSPFRVPIARLAAAQSAAREKED